MNLAIAQRYAEQLIDWLRPYCHRIEVAGSVRRRRPACNDVDLVCIPILKPADKNLLGEADGRPASLLREFLMKYVEDSNGAAWFRSGAGVPGKRETFVNPDAVNFLLQLRKCELDVFAANEETFTTRLVTRTGSKEHNIWIAERARRMAGRFEAQSGLVIGGRNIQPVTEQEFYQALDLPYIEPANREREFLSQHFGR